MIISSNCDGTFFSNFEYPKMKGLLTLAYEFEFRVSRAGNLFNFDVICMFNPVEIYTNKIHEVCKSETRYHLLTDGKITEIELYPYCIQALNENVSFVKQQDTDKLIRHETFTEPPFDYFQPLLQPVVNWFRS